MVGTARLPTAAPLQARLDPVSDLTFCEEYSCVSQPAWSAGAGNQHPLARCSTSVLTLAAHSLVPRQAVFSSRS